MSQAPLEYVLPLDDLTSQATWTVRTGTVVSGYDATALSNQRPWWPLRISGTHLVLEAAFAAAVDLPIVAFCHANFGPGTAITLEWDDDPAFGSIDRTETLVQGAYRENGFPTNVHGDFRNNTVPHFANLRISIVNTVAISIGEIGLIGAVQSLAGNLQMATAPADPEAHPATVHTTDAGVRLKQSRGVWSRRLTGSMFMGADKADQVYGWSRATFGPATPFWFLPHQRDDEIWYAELLTDLTRTYKQGQYSASFDFSIGEVARGLRPKPSAV